jgi:uncharacterized membrane protein YeaQ/YmgE (transglycosylase-associated protein family)
MREELFTMVPSYDILSMGEALSLDRFVHSQSGRGNQRMNVVVSNLSWLSWIIFGALAGWIASIFTGNNSRMGCLSNIIVGILGAFLGGWIYSLITGHALVIGWNWTAFLVAVLGAIVLLAVLNLFFGSRRTR